MEGSKTITTEITLKAVIDRMKDHVFYLGEAVKATPQLMEIGAKLQASADEDPILKDFISDSTSIVANLLSRVLGLTTYTNSGTAVTFTTSSPANTPDINAQLKDYIVNFMATYVLEAWLNLSKPDEAARFKEIRNRLETEITQLGAQRKKPTRE